MRSSWLWTSDSNASVWGAWIAAAFTLSVTACAPVKTQVGPSKSTVALKTSTPAVQPATQTTGTEARPRPNTPSDAKPKSPPSEEDAHGSAETATEPDSRRRRLPGLGAAQLDEVLWLIKERHLIGKISPEAWVRAINGGLSALKPPLRLSTKALMLKHRQWQLRSGVVPCGGVKLTLRRRMKTAQTATLKARRQARKARKARLEAERRGLTKLGLGAKHLACVMKRVKADINKQNSGAVATEDAETQAWGRAISALLRAIDPHASVIPAATFERRDRETGGVQSVGVGLVSQKVKGGHRVIFLQRTSPAGDAGVRLGDRIIAVDGEDVSDWPEAKVDAALHGAAKSQVRLTVYRGRRKRSFKATRRAVRESTVTARHHGPNGRIWAVRLGAFATGMSGDFAEVLRQLQVAVAAKPKAVVIDLRGNTGGHVSEAAAIADQFLVGGEVTRLKLRFKADEIHRAKTATSHPKTPLTLLVDGRCRSACELLVDALQARGRAVVVGDVTFGKGTAQRVYSTETLEPWNLILTIGVFHGPDGSSVQRRGVTPDARLAEVKPTERRERDHVNAVAERTKRSRKRRGLSLAARERLQTCSDQLGAGWWSEINRRDRALARALGLTATCLPPRARLTPRR